MAVLPDRCERDEVELGIMHSETKCSGVLLVDSVFWNEWKVGERLTDEVMKHHPGTRRVHGPIERRTLINSTRLRFELAK